MHDNAVGVYWFLKLGCIPCKTARAKLPSLWTFIKLLIEFGISVFSINSAFLDQTQAQSTGWTTTYRTVSFTWGWVQLYLGHFRYQLEYPKCLIWDQFCFSPLSTTCQPPYPVPRNYRLTMHYCTSIAQQTTPSNACNRASHLLNPGHSPGMVGLACCSNVDHQGCVIRCRAQLLSVVITLFVTVLLPPFPSATLPIAKMAFYLILLPFLIPSQPL